MWFKSNSMLGQLFFFFTVNCWQRVVTMPAAKRESYFQGVPFLSLIQDSVKTLIFILTYSMKMFWSTVANYIGINKKNLNTDIKVIYIPALEDWQTLFLEYGRGEFLLQAQSCFSSELWRCQSITQMWWTQYPYPWYIKTSPWHKNNRNTSGATSEIPLIEQYLHSWSMCITKVKRDCAS